MKCSRCGKELTEMVIDIKQKIDIYKIMEPGTFSPAGNISEETHEYLCPECFEKYAECINKLNEDWQGKYLIDMVEVVDEVQYGN